MKVEFLYGHDKEVLQFMTQFWPYNHDTHRFEHCKTIGVLDEDGKLVAAVVFYNYDTRADRIEAGIVSVNPHWLNRAVLKRMFEYVFIECDCQMLEIKVPAEHEEHLSILARLNFNFTLLPRWFGRDKDCVICTLTDDQWLDSRFSKRFYRGAVKQKLEAA
jgi:RimJ/RimL family protein N-acetyltransferase